MEEVDCIDRLHGFPHFMLKLHVTLTSLHGGLNDSQTRDTLVCAWFVTMIYIIVRESCVRTISC